MAPKTLAEMGFKVGDLVTFSSDKDSSGGVIFQIVEDTPPVEGAINRKEVERQRSVWDPVKKDYVFKTVKEWQYGSWDANGKKIMQAAVYGFVRLKLVFELFATKKGKTLKGKGKTLIVYYETANRKLKKVDLVTLGTKYMELGNIIREIAKTGSNDSQTQSA